MERQSVSTSRSVGDGPISLLSVFADHDDICFWQWAIADGDTHFPQNAVSFFKFRPDAVPQTLDAWLDDIVAPGEREALLERLRSIDTSKRHIDRFAFRIKDPDNAERWIEQRGVIDEVDGRLLVTWMSQDITQKRRTAADLEVTERQFDHLVQHASVGILAFDTDGRVTSCNPAFHAILGYSSRDLHGRSLTSLVHHEDARRHGARLQQLQDGEIEAFDCECRFLTKSGAVVWVETHAWAMPGRNEALPEFVAMITPIEERVQALEQLRQERDKLQAIFNHAGVGLAVTDAAGKVQAMNAEAVRIHGFEDWPKTEQSLELARSQFELRYPDGRLMSIDDWPGSRALRGEFVKDYDTILSRKDGSHSRYARYSCSPIRDADGNAIMQVYSIHDLTETHRLQEALSQSQRLEALGRLAGGIVHDFNNVLAVISGNLELIAKKQHDDRTRHWIQAALDAAETGASINQRLLAITRKKSRQKRTIDVVRKLRSMGELFRRIVGEDINLEVDVPDEKLFIAVDPGDLDSALLNLVANARDAMPDGGTLRIAVRRANEGGKGGVHRHPKGNDVVLSVQDTGIGMSKETIRLAAEPFFTTKPAGKGVGLGLTGVHAFADQNGGTVRIVSEIGAGTDVRIMLPETESCPEALEIEEDETPIPRGNGETVLVVEDDDRMRDLARQRLEWLGYRVEEAASADEASKRIAGGLRPACVFSDIRLPGDMNGQELANEIMAAHPDIGVLLCTSYPEDIRARHTRKTKPRPAILGKPCSLLELAQAVSDAIEDAVGNSGARSPMKT
ncbi:PAS domain S-box protein [Hartmannibacter diazotrophicus]|nr:PAS domain S-box protein [Hartmannibacter diazotrophicus]